MASLKTLLSQPLSWTSHKKKLTLQSNGEVVLELKEEKSSRATFQLEGKSYLIRNEGFWNPKTVLEKEGRRLLQLKRQFLGTTGKIEFENGKQYTCKVRNAPLAKLSFFTETGKEVLHYKIEAKPKPHTVLNIIDNSINVNELLMIIVIGCYSFKGIAMEDGGADGDILVLMAV